MGHLKISWAHLDTLVANWVGGLALFPKLFWQLSRALHPDKNPDLDKVSCRELRVTVSNFEGLTMFGIKDQGELFAIPARLKQPFIDSQRRGFLVKMEFWGGGIPQASRNA